MKWAIAAVVVAVVSVVVALVVAVGSTRDAVPGELRGCVLDGQAGIVRSEGDFGALARSDIGAGALREVRRTRLGEDTAVLLQGTRYRLLVLAGRKSPPLDGDLPRRLFERTNEYALVARELDPSRGVLADCVALVAAR